MKTALLIVFLMISGIAGSFFTDTSCAQVISYAADTVTREACDSAFYVVGMIRMYNLTDEDIPLKWERMQNLIPVEGAPFLIVAGIQYLPYTVEGMVEIDRNDSTEVVFNYFIDDMSPGDSAIYQIKIYATEDSVNTDQLLTGILYCPLATSLNKAESRETIFIYPNPFSTTTTIQLDEKTDHAQLVLFNTSGIKVRIIEIEGDKVEIDRDNLPGGVYAIGILEKGQVKATSRLLIMD